MIINGDQHIKFIYAVGRLSRSRMPRKNFQPGPKLPERPLREMQDDLLVIAGRSFRSRLMVGTGKFPSAEALRAALLSSEAEIAPG